MFRPAALLATLVAPTLTLSVSGSYDFYVRAYHGSLPSRAADILTVQIGQLTVSGLSPDKIGSLVGCSPYLHSTTQRRDAGPGLQQSSDQLRSFHAESALLRYGTEEQRREYLPQIARAEIRWCQGYSEPNAGSDLTGLQTKAEDQGDHYRVNGCKLQDILFSYDTSPSFLIEGPIKKPNSFVATVTLSHSAVWLSSGS